jgi:DAK2 domain fusion protein YloV
VVWDGPKLAEAFALAAAWLDHHHERVNALNVFPVPDGDTGTNMALTMRSALEAAADPAPSAGAVAARIAYGALMGARGNSGVILSQIFRGFAGAIQERDEIDGQDLARALTGARTMAYKAVMRPVEGTMLTVIRGAAERAATVAQRTPSLVTILHEAVVGAQRALDSTPELLDILRQAGVIDAGGQGVVLILEGLEKYANGESASIADQEVSGTVGANMAFLDKVDELHGDDAFGYCTNFMVFGSDMDFDRCRDDIAAMGQSAVIVGDDRILKVHIHTLDPGSVLAYAITLGDLDQIKIDNMTKQTEALSTQRSNVTPTSEVARPVPVPHGDLAIVAVAAGDGIAEALTTMGSTAIVRGGQTMNPSTEDLLKAVEAQPVDKVIVLPNNKNILLTANQLTGLTDKQVRVVPTRSIPQALAALAVFNADHSIDENVADMSDALNRIQTVELTYAVRDVELNGVCVSSGQTIGLLDDELIASGDSLSDVATIAFGQIDRDDAELISVFSGKDVSEDESEAMRRILTDAFPDAEVEVHDGGQPHYLFIIGIE